MGGGREEILGREGVRGCRNTVAAYTTLGEGRSRAAAYRTLKTKRDV